MALYDFAYSSNWPYFFSRPFLDYLNKGIEGEILYFKEEDAVIPFIVKSKFIFRIGYIANRPVSESRELSTEEEIKIIQKFLLFCEVELRLHFVKSTLHTCTYQLCHLPNLKLSNIGIIRVDLRNKKPEEIFNSFQSQYRNIIRKAEKDGVTVRTGIEYLEDFYKLYSERLKQESAPFDELDTIRILLQNDSLKRNILCAVAYVNSSPDAALLNFSGGGIACNLFAASKKNWQHKGSLKLLHWHCMQKYITDEIKYYQLGGIRLDEQNEKLDKIVEFKMRFGAEIEKGQHFIYAASRLYYNLYTILFRLKHIISW